MRCEDPVQHETPPASHQSTSSQLVKQEAEDCLGLKPDFYEDFNPMSVFDPMFSSLPPEAPLISLSRHPPPSSDSSSASSCSSSEYQDLRSGDALASYLYDFSEADHLAEERESDGGGLYCQTLTN